MRKLNPQIERRGLIRMVGDLSDQRRLEYHKPRFAWRTVQPQFTGNCSTEILHNSNSRWITSSIRSFGQDALAEMPTAVLPSRNPAQWSLVPNGILELRSNSMAGWTEKIHELRGNIAFSDGGVREVDTARLREVLLNAGVATNRLAMPLDPLQP